MKQEPRSDAEAARQALYRRLEGFDGHEPLLSRRPYQLAAYWRVLPGLYLRRLPLTQLLPLAAALAVLMLMWPVTLGLLLGLLRVLLVFRVLLIPILAVALALWLLHSLRRR